MKFLALVLVVAVIGVQTRGPVNLPKFESGVKNIIDKLRHGDNRLPLELPSLLPLVLDPTSITHQSFTMDLSEVTVNGLEELQVEWVRAAKPESGSVDLAVSLSISVPSTIVATADRYHLHGNVLGIQIDADGAFRAEVNNLKAAAIVKLARRGHGSAVVGLDLNFSADVEVNLNGAGSILNKFVNSLLMDLLADSDSKIFKKAKEIVTEMVNGYLGRYTPKKLIRLVETEG